MYCYINMLMKKIFISEKMRPISIFCVCCVIVQAAIICSAVAYGESYRKEESFLVKRGNRRILVSTENGEILAARVGKDIDGSSYLLHFITMEPNSVFLPVVLHSDMVFYVHTGSGKLLWTEESELKIADLRRGDVYRLKAGAVFFIQSNLETETERQKLRISSIFANSNTDLHEAQTGPYSSIRDMVLGFDKKVLQAAFKVPEEIIEELLSGNKPPAIIHGVSKSQRRAWEMETKFVGNLLGSATYNILEFNKKKRKSSPKLFNLFKESKDFENCNGWSTAVTGKKLSALKGTNIGLFMVNLTTGSMMGPHWNPVATEIALVVQGRGMVRVVCSSILNKTGCSDMRFEVEEGDIFAVPRFQPMAQMAFNNETFVFMGFSSSAKSNHPQFLVGQASVLRTLSKDVLGTSFNVRNTTMDQLLASQQDSVILGCISCAEEELRILEEEREKEKEEAREREEQETREREEEARRKEEEEAREREEEEARRKEEEEAREREEEEAGRQEEERERREEEEEARRKEEEEAREREEEFKRQEEEEREEEKARRKEEEEARKRAEKEAKRQEEERKRQREEEEERRRREEATKREEERWRKKEEAREEEERKRQQEEEESKRQQEAKRREEERKMREREQEEEEKAAAKRAQKERKRKVEAARREEEEEEERRRQEAEAKEREEEERQMPVEQEDEEAGKEKQMRKDEKEEARTRAVKQRWSKDAR